LNEFEVKMNKNIKRQKIIIYISFLLAFIGLMLVRFGHTDYWLLILCGLISAFSSSINTIEMLQKSNSES